MKTGGNLIHIVELQVDRPPEVSLTLKPQESFGTYGGEAYVQLDLIFECPWNYPDAYVANTFSLTIIS